MSERLARLGRWCRCHADAATAGVLTAASAAVLAAAGMLTFARALPVSACVLLLCALVGWRRRWPVAAAAAAGVLLIAPVHTRYSPAVDNGAAQYPAAAAVFLCAYALGSASRWRRSLFGLIPLVVGNALSAGNVGNPFVEMMTVGPWLGGLVVASRRRAADQLALRARELEEERELFAARSVRYERVRIARELHDIVAHAVTLMVVQASAGEHLAGADPAGAGEAFDSISEAAHQADGEIDRLVRLLDASAPAGPAAGLRIVEDLVSRVSASGVGISCRFAGDHDVPPEAADDVYRLVQEAVTNAIKHAAGAPIRVEVSGRTDAVEITVVNGPGHDQPSGLETAGGSHGLAGMRERAVRRGGTFGAGPTSERGWQVTASLPRQVARTAGADPWG